MRALLVTLSILMLAAAAHGGPTRLLSLDHEVEGTVAFGDEWQTTTYQLTVRDDVFAIRVKLSHSPVDLDLFISDSRGDVVAYSESTDFNETLFLSRVTDPALWSGRMSVEIAYQFDRVPSVDGHRLDEIPYHLVVESVRLEPRATLRPGRQISGRLLPEEGMAALYRVEVPESAAQLRIDASQTDADVDLFLFRGHVGPDPFMADYFAQTLRSSESLLVNGQSYPPLTGGTYYLLVVDQVALEQEATFRLMVSSTEDAPASLSRLPVIPVPESDLDRVILATVEILSGNGGGGSGCLLTPGGIILTNWHVVQAADGNADADLTVGMTLDQTRPPVELFRAEVIESSPERDLALLRITAGRYGSALSEISLPFVELRDTSVSIGEPLQFIGYPGVGGTGSRASVTYTRGVVSGFQRTAHGYSIKTDGEINSGSSGGAALDDAFRLVGVPTSIVGEDSGQLAYIVPVTAIPAEWMHHIRD